MNLLHCNNVRERSDLLVQGSKTLITKFSHLFFLSRTFDHITATSVSFHIPALHPSVYSSLIYSQSYISKLRSHLEDWSISSFIPLMTFYVCHWFIQYCDSIKKRYCWNHARRSLLFHQTPQAKDPSSSSFLEVHFFPLATQWTSVFLPLSS